MAEQREAYAYARRDLGALLTEHDQAIVVGAPGIGKSTRIDEVASELPLEVYRPPENLPEGNHEVMVVLDDFYDQFTWYRTADSEDREAYRDAVEQQIESNGSLFVCTTPYRLQWILERHRETFDELLGGLTGDWTVEPIRVDHDDAQTFLDDRLDESVAIEEFKDEIEWHYHFEEGFNECLREDEQFQDIFGDTVEYRTLVPGMLTATGSDASLQQILSDRQSALLSLKRMFKDVSASGAISGGSSLIDGAREYTETLDASGALDAVKSAVGSIVPDSTTDIPSETIGAGAAGAVLSGPALAVGCIGYWAWATHKKDEETRETVRDTFERILGSHVLELSAADREDLEAELGLQPKTLLYLNQAASGVLWQQVEQAMENVDVLQEDLDVTIDRVDEVEATVADHEEVIETLTSRLERIDATPGYMTFWEFEADLYDRPEYVSPGYRETDARESDPFDLTDPTPIKGEDALTRLLEIVTGDSPSVTTVVGESGIGKSRLLAEVGRELQDRDDVATWYVRNPGEFDEPPYESDTVVVFLDEAGGMEGVEQFFELTSENWRNFGVDCTVHVVAALRPVYQAEIKAIKIPTTERNEIKLHSLDQEGVVSLLSDTSVTAETAQVIYETTDGHPFLSRLLAVEEAGNDESRSPEEKIRDVIEDTMLREADLLGFDAEMVRGLLNAIAILGRYDPEVARTAVVEKLGIREYKHDELLKALRETDYVTADDKADTTDGTVYAHKIDVFAEYLRLQAIGDREHDWYDDLIAAVPLESLPGIVRGLVELYGTPLRRFEFVPEKPAKAEIKERLRVVSRRAVRAKGEKNMIRVQAEAARVAPGAIQNVEIEPLYKDPSEKTAEALSYFVTILYAAGEREADTIENHSGWLSSYARLGLNDLDRLARSHPYDDDIQLELAKTLTNSAFHEGKVGWMEKVQQRLDRLEELVDVHPDNDEIHLQFANGLYNAIHADGGAGRFQAVQQRLDRLEELVDAHPNNGEIHLRLAQALTNVIGYEGKVGKVKLTQQRLDRLEELVETHPNNGDIYVELAKALVNATNAEGKAGRFQAVQQRLDRLEELVETHPDNDEIHLQLAQALTNAALYEGKVGGINLTQHRIDRLEELVDAHPNNGDIHLELAKALFHTTPYEGGAERIKLAQQRLDRLEELVDAHPDNDEIHLKLAKALFNATNAEGESGRFQAVQQRLDRLDKLVESHPDNDEIHLELASALTNATLYEGEAGRFQAVQQRLDRLGELVKGHSDTSEIIEQGSIAHVVALRCFVYEEMYENASDAIEALYEIAESFDRLYLGDRGTTAETSLQDAGEELLRTERLGLLEQLLGALRTGLSEARVASVCTDLLMTADELFWENEINMDTYTRVTKLCQD